jgi:hypothetical protein
VLGWGRGEGVGGSLILLYVEFTPKLRD